MTAGTRRPRFQNGSFGYTDPRHCSRNDPTGQNCWLFNTNPDGFYESSPVVVRVHRREFVVHCLTAACSTVLAGAIKALFAHTDTRLIVSRVQFVPQDTAKLIEMQGGPERFISRLDFIFDQVCHAIYAT